MKWYKIWCTWINIRNGVSLFDVAISTKIMAKCTLKHYIAHGQMKISSTVEHFKRRANCRPSKQIIYNFYNISLDIRTCLFQTVVALAGHVVNRNIAITVQPAYRFKVSANEKRNVQFLMILLHINTKVKRGSFLSNIGHSTSFDNFILPTNYFGSISGVHCLFSVAL